MLGVALDRLDDQVQFVRAVDLARHAVVFAWGDGVGSGEVVQAVDPAGRVVLHEKHDTGSRFHTGQQEQMIGADDKHGVRMFQPTARYTRNRDQQARGFRNWVVSY